MATAQQYPIDFGALKKGDYISPGQIEEIFGTVRDSSKHSIALMKLVSEIHAHRSDLSACSHKFGIRINLDSEATEYHHDQVERGVRKILRHSSHLATRVDRNQLTDTQQKEHDQRVALNAARVFSIQRPRIQGPEETPE